MAASQVSCTTSAAVASSVHVGPRHPEQGGVLSSHDQPERGLVAGAQRADLVVLPLDHRRSSWSFSSDQVDVAADCDDDRPVGGEGLGKGRVELARRRRPGSRGRRTARRTRRSPG